VAITFDPKKRAATFAKRGLDFQDAEIVFAGTTFEVPRTIEGGTARRESSALACYVAVSW